MNKKVKLLTFLCSVILGLNLFAKGASFFIPANVFSLAVVTPVANFTSNKTVICAGDSISFTDLSTNAPTAWKWTFGGGTPPTCTVQNPTIVYNTPGNYTVKLVVSNSAGSDSLTIVNYVTVNPVPSVTVNPGAAWICSGDSVLLTASGALTYNWKPAIGLNCSSCQAPYAKPAATTTYTVTGTNGSGCSDSAFVTINVGKIIVTINGSSGTICQNNKDTLTAFGASSYLWSNGKTTSTIIVNPSVNTTYSVMGTSLTCMDSASFAITVNPSPTITISGKDSICPLGSTTLTASGAATYVWAPSSGLSCNNCPVTVASPTVTSIYTIIGTDANGCSNAVTYTVSVLSDPSVTANRTSPICVNESVSISAVGTPSGGTYTWQPGNETGQSVVVTPLSNTTYTVTYSTFCGKVTDTVTVVVSPTPEINMIVNFKAGCVSLCDIFSAVNTVPQAKVTSWLWSFGDGGTSTKQNPSYCYEKPGKYGVSLYVTTATGCTSTTDMGDSITVYSLPKANFTYSPNPATIIDPLVNFSDNSTDQYKIIRYSWTFGDGSDSTSNSRFPSHNYADTGTYCPKLVVMDIHTCIDTAKICFDINTQYSFYIPSSFSPNGDGVNDIFMPKGTDVSSFEMYIFDRWGLQLYHTSNIADGWNGKLRGNGPICQEDVYEYVINVTDNKGIQHHFTGALYLLK